MDQSEIQETAPQIMPQTSTLVLEKHRTWLQWGIPIAALLSVALNWAVCDVPVTTLQQEVPVIRVVDAFETKKLYAGLLLFTISFPLLFGFLPRLQFHKMWFKIFLANIPVTLFFILWDVYFTQAGVWGFSDRYTTGITWLGLPMEEWLFFLIIPFACIFIYWAIDVLHPREVFAQLEKKLSIILILCFFGLAIWQYDKIYTATTAMLAGFFLLYHLTCIDAGYRGKFYLMFALSCIPFLLINGILTGSFTSQPVVMYHAGEIIGTRMQTIPVEDSIYSFLMLMANITFFEKLRKSGAAN